MTYKLILRVVYSNHTISDPEIRHCWNLQLLKIHPWKCLECLGFLELFAKNSEHQPEVISFGSVLLDPPGLFDPEKLSHFHVLLQCDLETCCGFVGKDKPRSIPCNKQRKTNLSRTIKLDKIMGSWTFMEEIKTLQELKIISWFTPQLWQIKPRTSTKFRRTELWMRPHWEHLWKSSTPPPTPNTKKKHQKWREILCAMNAVATKPKWLFLLLLATPMKALCQTCSNWCWKMVKTWHRARCETKTYPLVK